jgi:hypothetical protein
MDRRFAPIDASSCGTVRAGLYPHLQKEYFVLIFSWMSQRFCCQPITCASLGRAAFCAWVCLSVLLTGCSTPGKVPSPQEKFGSVETYSRLFDAAPSEACEAARRALLSQGYLVNTTGLELIEGKKNFQPEAESHLEMRIRVVCVRESTDGKVSLAFATAVQDRYALKKDNSSASLGVSAIGSVSIPFMSGSDSMVKVGSETIADDQFYERFFDLVKRYLVDAEVRVE